MEAWLSVLPLTLTVAAGVSLVLAVVLLLATWSALRKGRFISAGMRLMFMVLFGLVVTLLGMLAVGVRGFQTLTAEESAAVVSVEPIGPQLFEARFLFPDGHTQRYKLAGDELYVDARIIKWKYWANVLGLHTAFELDRVAGRYRDLADEMNKPRTLQSLARERPVNLFELRRRFDQLAPFYDAEYGSATFVPADQPAMYEILVSTTGLLARPVRAASDPVPETAP